MYAQDMAPHHLRSAHGEPISTPGSQYKLGAPGPSTSVPGYGQAFLPTTIRRLPPRWGGGGVGDQGPAPRGTTARPSPRLEQVPSREVGGESRPKERQIPSKNREIIKKGVLRVKPPRGNYPPLASRPLPPPSLPPLSAPSGINPEREARSPARSRQIDPRGGHISLYPPVSSGVGLA